MSIRHTLESVRLEMNHWRRNKTGCGRIPNRIWSNALGLIDKHSISEICCVLRVSHNQFKAKLKHQDPFTLKSDTPFYEIAMPSTKHRQTDIQLGCSIEIRSQDGTHIAIEHLSYPALIQLISIFLKGNECFN